MTIPIVRADLRAILEEAGFAVVPDARDGAEAVELAREHAPDLIVLDLGLPGLDGFDAATTDPPRERDVPIVALTAHNAPEMRTRAAHAGADNYVVKPFSEEALLQHDPRGARRPQTAATPQDPPDAYQLRAMVESMVRENHWSARSRVPFDRQSPAACLPTLRESARALARRMGGIGPPLICRLQLAPPPRSTSGRSRGYAGAPARWEIRSEDRLNRNLDQLLQELRVVIPGVQVLFAFLLAVPFATPLRPRGPVRAGRLLHRAPLCSALRRAVDGALDPAPDPVPALSRSGTSCTPARLFTIAGMTSARVLPMTLCPRARRALPLRDLGGRVRGHRRPRSPSRSSGTWSHRAPSRLAGLHATIRTDAPP